MSSTLRTILQALDPSSIFEEVEDYPITYGFFILFLLVYFIEYAVAYGIGAEAYRFWFQASPNLTPGLLFAIVSHSVVPGFRFHVIVNGALMLVVGRLIEDEQSGYEYVGLFLLFGYLTTFGQLAVLMATGATDPTMLGASGSVAAFAAVNVVWWGIGIYRDEVVFPGQAVFVVASGFVIWWLLQAAIPGLAGSHTGVVSHVLGVGIGLLYGIVTVGEQWR